MKTLLVLFLSALLVSAALPRERFSVRCPKPGCPLGKQQLPAIKAAVTGSTTVTNGMMQERVLTFKCPQHGKFTARNKVFVPTGDTEAVALESKPPPPLVPGQKIKQ